MSDFTYESQQTTQKLETYEWDNVWWEHAGDASRPRALLIGDSISCAYRRMVTEELSCAAYADGFGSSKGIDNPYLLPSIEMFLQQSPRCDAILLNNGLHGWHLSTEEYRTCYQSLLQSLMERHPGKLWGLVLTTPMRLPEDLTKFHIRNDAVQERNAVVREIAASLNLPVLDYYAVLCERPEVWSEDGVHLKELGYRILAKICAAFLREQLSL